MGTMQISGNRSTTVGDALARHCPGCFNLFAIFDSLPSTDTGIAIVPLDLDRIQRQHDIVIATVEKYNFEVTLNADRISAPLVPRPPALNWQSIKFNAEEEIDHIPDDKRGVYAFVISTDANPMPIHGYIMYIGIAGRDSNRSLRTRYREYLTMSAVLRRPKINTLIANWYSVLRFFFAPVDDDFPSADLKDLEIKLNTAWMPPCVEADIEASTRRMRSAFL